MFTSLGTYKACGLFNMSHIVASFICVALALILVYLTKDSTKEQLKIHYNIVAVILSVMLVFTIVWNLFQDQIKIEDIIPLSISFFFVLALWLMNSKKLWLRNLAKVFVGYVGVAFGFLLLIVPIPSFTNYPLFHFKSLFALFTYTSMFCLGLMQFVVKEVEINFKNLSIAVFLMLDIVIDCLVLNLLFDANFLFLFSPNGLNIPCLNCLYTFNNNIYTLAIVLMCVLLLIVTYLVVKFAELVLKHNNKK